MLQRTKHCLWNYNTLYFTDSVVITFNQMSQKAYHL